MQDVPAEAVLQGLLYLRRLLENPDTWLGGVGHFDIAAIDTEGNEPTKEEYEDVCIDASAQLSAGAEVDFDFHFTGFQHGDDFLRYIGIRKEN